MAFDVVLITDTAIYPEWSRGYGAHRLASHLRINGYTVLVIDFSSALSFDHWIKICDNAIDSNTKMLGISTTWLPYRTPSGGIVTELRDFDLDKEQTYPKQDFVNDLAKGNYSPWLGYVKQKSKNIKIVVGGPKIDFYQDLPADHFVRGLGETQVIDILTKSNLPKLVDYDREAKQDAWSWNQSKTQYTNLDFIKPNESLTLETSRGCRFKCSFCSYPLIGQKNMMNFMKSKDALYSELSENYERWGTVSYTIADDTLNDSTEKLEYLLDVTRKLDFKLNFWAYVRLDVIAVNPQQLEMLKELGIKYSWIGIDSFHPVASKLIGKGMDADRKKETLVEMRNCWGNDTEIVTSYIVGLPKEPKSHVEEVNDWLIAKDSPVDHASFIPLRLTPPGPLPNVDRSIIDNAYQKYGYNIPNMQKFWEWTKDDGTDIETFKDANELSEKINQQWDIRPKYRQLNEQKSNQIKDPKLEYFEPLIRSLEKL